MKPYIVTEDLRVLVHRWCRKVGFACPHAAFFLELREDLLEQLRTIFDPVVFITFEELSGGIGAAVARLEGTTVVSIDRVYNNAPYHLETNRIADLNSTEIIGEAPRPGHLALPTQVSALPNDQPICLEDDGCFSGETLCQIYEWMSAGGYEVTHVVVGVLIDRTRNKLLDRHSEVKLIAVREFPSCIDWICERDFFVGAPLSGRTAGERSGQQVQALVPEVALPYCLPFGDPISGASIPSDKAITFSKFIIGLSIKLWTMVERQSDRRVLCRDIPRLPRGVERDDQGFVDVLTKTLQNL